MSGRLALRRLVGSPRGRVALVNVVRGLLMGSFDVVPGVSGGTVALVVGIYERLIASIRSLVDAGTGLLRADLRKARAALGETEWWLLVPLLIGIGVAIATLARVVEPLLEEETGNPAQARAVFFGLICGTLVIPWRRGGGLHGGRWLLAGLAATFAFVLSGLPETEVTDPAYLAVFASATVAICAMILPGVSGSFILLTLGMYAPTLAAVNDRELLYLGVFAAGAVVGLAGFSKLLNWLLTRRHDATMAVLLGLMVGSLRAVWPYLDSDRGLQPPPGDASALVEVGLAVGAFGLVTAVIAIARRKAGDRVVFGRPGDPVGDVKMTR